MNPLYPLSSFVEKQKEEQEEQEDPNLKLYIFSSSPQVVASSSSSSQLAFATYFSTSATQNDPRVNLHHHLQESHHQLPHDHYQGEKSIGGLREGSSEVIFSSTSSVKPSVREAFERSRSDDHQQEQLEDQITNKQDNGSATKYWMPSKMRLMQKMMINTDKKVGGANSSDPKATRSNNNTQNNFGNSNQGNGGRWEIRGRSSCNSNGCVRVCSDCNTTTTPLWRSGPQGPKSLCNACGIRQRKARRAMAEAVNGGGSVVALQGASGKELHKEKKSRLSCHGDAAVVAHHVKNKCNKMRENSSDSQSEGTNDVSFDGRNFTLRVSKSGSAFGRVFPRDEEEAAILLMELSCGLLHSC